VYIEDKTEDGGKVSAFTDISGTVSGYRGAFVTPNWGYYITPNCVISSVFGVACPHRYALLEVIDMDKGTGNGMTINRNQHAGTNHATTQMTFKVS
jgi:hypothetical protein